MSNPYRLLLDLLPKTPLQVGDVAGQVGELFIITLPDGGQIQARGTASVGDRVFVRDGLIEGAAPTLPVEIIVV